jgi:hypothetical protein
VIELSLDRPRDRHDTYRSDRPGIPILLNSKKENL